MNEYEKELYKIIGSMLRSARCDHEMTLEQLASKLHLTTKTIQRYEMGERKIKIDILMAITRLFGIDYGQFMVDVQRKLNKTPEEQKPIQYVLTEEQKELLELYDQLIDVDKQAALQNIRGLLAYRAMEKKHNPPASEEVDNNSDLVG